MPKEDQWSPPKSEPRLCPWLGGHYGLCSGYKAANSRLSSKPYFHIKCLLALYNNLEMAY